MTSARDRHEQDGAGKTLPRRSLLRAAVWSVPATTLVFGAGATAAGAASSFEFVPDQVVIPTIDSAAKVVLDAYQTNGTPIPAGETIFVGVSHGVRWADGTVYPRFFTLAAAGKLEIDGIRVENESVLPGIVTASYGTQKAVAYIILAPKVTEPTPPAIGAGHLYWWNESDDRVVKDVGQVCEDWNQNPWGTIRTVMPIDIRPSLLIDNRARDIWLYDGPQEYMGGLNKSEMDARPQTLPVVTGQQVRAMSSTRWGTLFYAWRYIDISGKYGLCLYSSQAPLDQGNPSEPIAAKKHYFPQGKSVMTERSNKKVKDLAATIAVNESSVQNPVPLVLFEDGELCTVAGVWSPFSTVVAATDVAVIAHVNRGGAFRFALNDGRIGTYSFVETAVAGNVNTGTTSYSTQRVPGTPVAISWNDSSEPFVLLASGLSTTPRPMLFLPWLRQT
ncbi:hypothetical protein G7066_12670 [Leucobacter coleopterorum]|uniref:LVIVD repeat-containing protein n=1 Tax=Leucobacter coleopterorum TaxID=2714933 RepID=A0ABX6JY09_9MICO|nr:hypothetical protein [Leucobacter coleopterorum]QIM19210.1 hypothetical protein G7066_12670 [Leucobacter coleopterorum]